jgi:hypothetical protein
MKKSIIGLLIAMGICTSAIAANNDEWWEYSTEMEGMGGISMPAQKDCYRKDNIVPSGGEDCTSSNMKQSGNKYSADFSCKDGTTGHIEGSQSGKESTFKMTSKSKGESFSMTQKGKMLGSCNWATDSNEAKACGTMNKSVASNKAEIKKECDSALKNDDFSRFLVGTSSDASVNLAGKKCGGSIDSGCSEQRPKMCAKIKDTLLKDVSGDTNGFKKVMDNKSGVDLAKSCNVDTGPATKQFCSNKMKDATRYQGDIVKFCESDAKALYALHCAGRDYTAQKDGGYGTICSSYGKPSAASGQESANTSGDSSSNSGDPTKGTTNPIDGAVKGVKKLKDVFGF